VLGYQLDSVNEGVGMNMHTRIAHFKQKLVEQGLIDSESKGGEDPRKSHPTDREIHAFTQWKDSNPRPWNDWRDFTNFKDWESCGY